MEPKKSWENFQIEIEGKKIEEKTLSFHVDTVCRDSSQLRISDNFEIYFEGSSIGDYINIRWRFKESEGIAFSLDKGVFDVLIWKSPKIEVITFIEKDTSEYYTDSEQIILFKDQNSVNRFHHEIETFYESEETLYFTNYTDFFSCRFGENKYKKLKNIHFSGNLIRELLGYRDDYLCFTFWDDFCDVCSFYVYDLAKGEPLGDSVYTKFDKQSKFKILSVRKEGAYIEEISSEGSSSLCFARIDLSAPKVAKHVLLENIKGEFAWDPRGEILKGSQGWWRMVVPRRWSRGESAWHRVVGDMLCKRMGLPRDVAGLVLDSTEEPMAVRMG